MTNFFFRIYSEIYNLYLRFLCKNINLKGRIIFDGFSNIEISKNAQIDILGTITLRSGVLIAVRNDAKLLIKDGCFFNRNISIVFGENVKIYDNDHRVVNDITCRNIFDTKEITIGDYCWVGNDVNILKGSIIKNKTIIGAMSLVKGKLNKPGIYVGIPVKPLASIKR